MNLKCIMYIVKHNYILGGMFTNTKAQLHVSAINVGHLQVVHEKTYQYAKTMCMGISMFHRAFCNN